MEKLIIYHGSDHKIEKPSFGYGNIHNDYGIAFYCTSNLENAKEWANRYTSFGYANKYSIDLRGLKILDLTSSDFDVLNWIAVLMHFRSLSLEQKELYKRRLAFLEEKYFINVDDFDVIIGYRADDAYFKFPMFFIQNELSVDKLKEIYQLGNLDKQIAIKSEKAFKRLKFIKSIVAESEYHDQYYLRKNQADIRFEEIRIQDVNSNKIKIEDLIKKYDKR